MDQTLRLSYPSLFTVWWTADFFCLKMLCLQQFYNHPKGGIQCFNIQQG